MDVIELRGLGLNITIKEFDISFIEHVKEIISSSSFDVDNYLWSGDHLPLFDNIKNEFNINVL